MKRINDQKVVLNDIYNLIGIGQYNYAKKQLNMINNDKIYHNYSFEIDFLYKYIKEKEHNKERRNSKYSDLIEMYIHDGKYSSYFNDGYESDIYLAGYYVTNEIQFLFLAGRALYMNNDTVENGIKLLEDYLEKGGAIKAYKAYEYLGKYYSFVDFNKSKQYFKKRDKLLSIMTINNVSNIYEEIAFNEDTDDRIKMFIKNKRIELVDDLFNIAGEKRQIDIIIELYKNGFKKKADELLKKLKKEPNIDKHSKKLVYNLEQNKKLYINKAKNLRG